MEKNARRKIISEKSEYVKKPRKWNLFDEIQFRRIRSRLKNDPVIYHYGVRTRVRMMLEKYGYKVSHIANNCYRIAE